MRILIVASYNKNRFAPFILEQADALQKQGCEVDFCGLVGKGVCGYLKNYSVLRRIIKEFKPDVIHAHYGLSGLLANMQRCVPVITTYHGSDINDDRVFRFSRVAMQLSKFNIFVSKANMEKANLKKNAMLLPCGISLENFPVVDKQMARKQMSLDESKKIILFAGAFDNMVKNASLAKETCSLLDNVELIELKGYARQEVAILMQAVDALLLTSVSEGSPQVIKEAMACGCPIVSVDVGDVRERLDGIKGCFVANESSPQCLSELLKKTLTVKEKTGGRARIVADGLENKIVAKKLITVYSCLSHCNN